MAGAAAILMTQRNALLLGDLGDGGGLAGIEGADQKLGAVADHLFRPGAGGIDIRFGVDADDSELGQAERFEDRRRHIDAALTVLADAGLEAGPRQQHADLQWAALGAHDVERRHAGNECGGTGARGKSATGNAPGFRLGCRLHRKILPRLMVCSCCFVRLMLSGFAS